MIRLLFPFRVFSRFDGALRRFVRGVVDAEIMLGGFVTLPGSADEPPHRFGLAFGHAATGLVTQAEIALRRRDFLIRRGAIPFDRFLVILRHHLALLVKHAEVELRLRFAAFRRAVIPLHRFSEILRNALTGFVEHAEIELRRGIALLGGFAKPPGGLAKFLRDAVAGHETTAEITLRHGIVLLRCAAIPFDRLRVILLHALARLETDAEIALRLRIALVSRFPHFFKRLPCPPIACHAECWVKFEMAAAPRRLPPGHDNRRTQGEFKPRVDGNEYPHAPDTFLASFSHGEAKTTNAPTQPADESEAAILDPALACATAPERAAYFCKHARDDRYDRTEDRTRDASGKVIGSGDQRLRALGEGEKPK